VLASASLLRQLVRLFVLFNQTTSTMLIQLVKQCLVSIFQLKLVTLLKVFFTLSSHGQIKVSTRRKLRSLQQASISKCKSSATSTTQILKALQSIRHNYEISCASFSLCCCL